MWFDLEILTIRYEEDIVSQCPDSSGYDITASTSELQYTNIYRKLSCK